MPGMAMDPMAAASQGMFGGFGMNMNGMNSGMNMGMNFDASQGMYGGWDSAQNNTWNGTQDKFNPNAFANGMGPQYGGPSGFGGYNMSQPNGNYAQMQQPLQFPNPDFQNGFQGYGRGGFRGRGQGFFPGGRGRGGYSNYAQTNYPPNADYAAPQGQGSPMNQEKLTQPMDGVSARVPETDPNTAENKNPNEEPTPGHENETADDTSKEATAAAGTKDVSMEGKPADAAVDSAPTQDTQLRGIPTIDSIDKANAAQATYNRPLPMPAYMGPSFGRGGYMRGPFQGGRGGGFPGRQPNGVNEAPGPGVVGAPAAPRAMREGLPNTSILRQRGFQMAARASASSGRPSESLPR